MLTLKNLSLTAADAQGRADIVKKRLSGRRRRKIPLSLPARTAAARRRWPSSSWPCDPPPAARFFWTARTSPAFPLPIAQSAAFRIRFQQPPRFKGMKVSDLLTIAAGKALSHDEACSYLTQVGLCARDYLNRDVDTSLSGGEVKRIEIATLLAKNSRLMIFDEPEAGIDLWSFARLTETFRELHEKGGRTILIISHQERIIRLADEIILIANGEIAGRGTADENFIRSCCRRRCGLQSAGGERNMLNDIQKSILKTVSDMTGIPDGAVNIRLDGQSVPPELRAYPDCLQDRQGRHRHQKSRPLPKAKTCISLSY